MVRQTGAINARNEIAIEIAAVRAATASVILFMLVASPGSAQAPQPVDSGTLTSTFNSPMGTRTSTEDFTIVRNADGGYTMTTVTTEGRRMRSVLTTDAFGAPIAYEHHGRGGEAVEKTITSKRDESGALVNSELSTRNPPFPPFRFTPNTLLFGEGGTAQLWFLGLGSVPREVSYFETGTFWRNGVQKARLSEVGTESVTIAGSPVAATHHCTHQWRASARGLARFAEAAAEGFIRD